MKPARIPNVSLVTETGMFLIKNVQSPHKCWFTLKSVVFGSSSSLPPHVGGGGGLVCESVDEVICCRIILTASSPRSLLICHSLAIHFLVFSPFPIGRVRSGVSCKTFALMVALTNWVCFVSFLKRAADVMAPRLSVVYRRLVCLGSFPAC